jgi:hypothetical protein
MAHVHITLVGEQLAPVYNGILSANPDMVLFVHSSKTFEHVGRIKENLRLTSKSIEFDPSDLNDISNKVAKIIATYGDSDKISVNISSGTKAWTYFFIQELSPLSNVSFFYVDQNNKIWDLKNKTNSELTFDMDRQLNLYSDKALTEYTPFKQFTQQDFEQIKKIREVRNFNRLEFNELTSKMYEFQQNKELSGQQHEKVVQSESKMSELVWNRATDSYRMLLFKQGNSQKKLEVEFCSPNITKLLLNTGWFEYEVASILAKWKYAKEIRLGCRFSTKETKDDKNEVDIIINTGTKLLFVECKTYIKNITDIDKFRSVVRNYGGLNSKAIFITDETIDLKAKEKLDDNRLMSFSLKDNHLNLPLEKALFLLLESELNQINPR